MIKHFRFHLQSVHSTILLSRIVGGILQVAMFTIVAREIGATRFGPMISGLVTVQLIGTLVEFGFGALVMSQRFFLEMRYLVGTLLATTVTISAIEALLGFLIYFLIQPQSSYLSSITLLMLWGAGEKLSNIGLSLAITLNDSKEVRRNILSRKIFSFCCFLIISLELSWTSENFCLFLGATSITGGAISIFRFRKYFSEIHLKNINKVFRMGIPFYSNSVANQLRNLDVFFLNFFVSPLVAGNYALALRYSQPFSIPMSTLAQTGITAFSSKGLVVRKKFLTRYSRVFKFSLFCACLVLLFPMDFIVQTYLPTYSELSLSFKVQCFAFILFGIIALETSILQGVGREIFLAKFSIFWIFATLILIVAGGLYKGVIGSSLGLLLGNLIQSIFLLRNRKRAINDLD